MCEHGYTLTLCQPDTGTKKKKQQQQGHSIKTVMGTSTLRKGSPHTQLGAGDSSNGLFQKKSTPPRRMG